ncbi:MAG: TonB-dependent receptor [Muribaculaceae bacterium]|nr:TonB-dependent receptor [Muribaculaceae bacterium]
MKKAFNAIPRLLAVLLCSFSVLWAAAQTTVKGTVLDEQNEPLIGATVALKGNPKVAVATDVDGNFSLRVPDTQATLVFSYVGYETQEQKLNGNSSVSVKLKPDTKMLDDVVVVGYGKQRKVTLTGSVSAVGSKDLLQAPMQNVSNMLTGKISGLSSIQSSGQPGADGATLLVRGINGFSAKSPLVLIDGVEGDLNLLNPQDVESVSVLKDASAAIYGVRGANGVILITTKGGEGAPKINYAASFSAVRNTAFPEYLNASEFMYYKNKARMMDGLEPLISADIQQKVLSNDPDSPFGETDWFDEIFRTGFTQQHTVSASGSTNRVNYYTSLGYMDQNGTVKGTDYQRYNALVNLSLKVAKGLTFSTSFAGTKTDRHWPGVSFSKQSEVNPIRQAANTAPIIKKEWNGYPLAWKEGDAINVNPLAAIEKSGCINLTRYQINSNFKLEYDFSDLYEPLKGLQISAFFAYKFIHQRTKTFNKGYQVLAFNEKPGLPSSVEQSYAIGMDGSLERIEDDTDYWQFRPMINYFRTFGQHTVGATFLYEKSRYGTSMLAAWGRGFLTNDPVDITMGTDKENVSWPQGEHQHTGMASYAGRVNYDFDSRYLFEFAFRRDGSYVFAPENRWGFFPSVSAGWVMSREKFMENIHWLDFLKLRLSYGESGDDSVDPFLYNNLFGQSNNGYILGDSAIPLFYTTSPYVYRNLTWAKTQTYNLGLEFNLFHNRLGAEIDVFYKRTKDILEGASGAYPPSLGGYYPNYGNTGEMDNRGFEIALNHNLNVTRDFSYRVRGTFGFARNKILKRKVSDSYPNYRGVLGQPIGTRYGFHCLGLFQTQEEIDNYPQAPSGETLLGDIKYQDYNGDGIISRDFDYVKIGYGQWPEMNFSLAIDLNYRNFYCNMLWQGVAHCDYQLQGVYDSGTTASTVYTSSFGTGNSPKYLIEGAWTPENTNAKYPRLSTVPRFNNAWVSDWWVVNGDYLRLKNIQIGYNFPTHLLTRTPFTGVNLYVAGSNVLTFSHFKYIDPESPSVSNGYYPQQATYSFGLNVSF